MKVLSEQSPVKRTPDRRPLLIGGAASLLHLLLIAAIADIGLTNANPDPDWPIVWVIVLIVDFPMSLLYPLMPKLPESVHLVSHPTSALNDIGNFWQPLLFFGVLGTLWWFGVAAILSQFLLWLNRRKFG